MAYLFNVNNGVTDFSQSLFDIIEDMITQGWRVLGSGDGVAAYENTGDTGGAGGGSGGGFHVITNGGSGALGMDNATFNVGSSWVRLAAPLASEWPQLEYLWERSWRGGLNSDSWRIMVSTDGVGFDTGGDANTAPVALDEVSLAGNQTRSAGGGDFRTFVPSGGSVNMHWAIGGAAERYAFFAWNLRQSDEGVWGAWGLDPVGALPPGSNPPTTEDPLDFVHLISHDSSSGNSFNSFRVDQQSGFYDGFATDTKVEDFGAVTPLRGAFAHFGYGEAGPPAYAGLYRVAALMGCDGNATLRWTSSVGADLTSGKQIHLVGLPYMRMGGATVQFYKGTGTLLGHTLEGAATTDDDGVTARFKRSGTSVPWPVGVGFIL